MPFFKVIGFWVAGFVLCCKSVLRVGMYGVFYCVYCVLYVCLCEGVVVCCVRGWGLIVGLCGCKVCRCNC